MQPMVLHFRDLRASDDLLKSKYRLRSEVGIAAEGFQQDQVS